MYRRREEIARLILELGEQHDRILDLKDDEKDKKVRLGYKLESIHLSSRIRRLEAEDKYLKTLDLEYRTEKLRSANVELMIEELETKKQESEG